MLRLQPREQVDPEEEVKAANQMVRDNVTMFVVTVIVVRAGKFYIPVLSPTHDIPLSY